MSIELLKPNFISFNGTVIKTLEFVSSLFVTTCFSARFVTRGVDSAGPFRLGRYVLQASACGTHDGKTLLS